MSESEPREYRIGWVSPPSPWNGQYGPMVGYTLKIDGDGQDRNFGLNQKPQSPPPVPGQTIYATIESKARDDGSIAWKLKRAQKPQAAQPTLNGGSARGDDTDARIQRQWALKAALSLAAEARERGVTVEQLLGNIRQLADKLEAELIVNRPALPSLAGSETAAQAEGVISEPPPPSAALQASEQSW